MRRILCAALLILIAPLQAAEPDSLAAVSRAIDACAPRLDAQVDVGYDRVAARCPDLARALEQSGVEQWLPQGWKETRNNLSVGSLREMRAVVERELATQPPTHKPRVERLDEVLVSLGDTHRQDNGTWRRFRKWLRDLIDRRDRADNEDWFDQMVSRTGVSDAIVEIVTYVALGAMVVLALIIVLNELKAAGLLGRRARTAADENRGESSLARPVPTFREIERAPLIERPRMLLELIASKLTAMKRLPPAGALTVRELASSVQLEGAQDRERLATLALTAERARYSESGVAADALELAYEQGRELLGSVEKLRPPETAVSAAS
ncbi:MAG: hypothetical protein WDO56_32570 [Gammaproteobacteria bacterium]